MLNYRYKNVWHSIVPLFFRALLLWGGRYIENDGSTPNYGEIFRFDLSTYTMVGGHKKYDASTRITDFPEFAVIKSDYFPNLVCEIAT